jgi:two-component system, NtrC family, nitrogen regulation sensor histidine kinase NtrY
MAYETVDRLLNRSFNFSIVLRLVLIFFLGTGLSISLQGKQTVATSLLLALLIVLVAIDLLQKVQRTNFELTRLLNALTFRDFTQSFEPFQKDSGFGELGQALESLLKECQNDSMKTRAELAQLRSLIDHVPIALLAIDNDDQVELLNNQARRQFPRAIGRHVADYSAYGERFAQGLANGANRAGELTDRVVEFSPVDEASVRMRLTETLITYNGKPQRLLALLPIQAELDANELALSRKLARVLTHEILNSLTPIVSLSRSAQQLTTQLPENSTGHDIRAAIETIERRADGLLQFAQRYREITMAPAIRVSPFFARELINDLVTLIRAEISPKTIDIDVDIDPIDLQIVADRQLIEHVLLNVLRNAAQACAKRPNQPRLRCFARKSSANRALVEIHDNGPGIPEVLHDDVFLPFFTTKPTGSGIGLSVSKQIIMAHGGSISVSNSSLGGACVRCIF